MHEDFCKSSRQSSFQYFFIIIKQVNYNFEILQIDQMNSSKGFKRTLRPPSSGAIKREKQVQLIKSFDISQSQTAIMAMMKTQLSQLQQEINALDQDKRIRTAESSLEKSYATVLKKWIKEVQNINLKEFDDKVIMKSLGVENYQEGFKKLWSLLYAFDQISTKMTEVQIVHLLKYDSLFHNIAEDSKNSERILTNMSKTGFVPGLYQVSQVLLQRSKDIYPIAVSKSKGMLNNTANSSKSINSEGQAISSLKKQNAKLEKCIKQLEEELSKATSSSRITEPMIAESIASNSKPGSYEDTLVVQMKKMKTGFEKKIIQLKEELANKDRQHRKKESQFRIEGQKYQREKNLLLKKFDELTKKKE